MTIMGDHTNQAARAKVIAIVDDEPNIVDMLSTFLQIKGYEVRMAYSGVDGLALIQVENPHALLLDLMLPDIDGFEVLARLRAMPVFAALPVLVISARTDPQSRTKAEQAGANAYLTKPVRMAELVEHLDRLLDAPSSLSAPSTPSPAPDKPAPSSPQTTGQTHAK